VRGAPRRGRESRSAPVIAEDKVEDGPVGGASRSASIIGEGSPVEMASVGVISEKGPVGSASVVSEERALGSASRSASVIG
jgi:hypothetical protein